MRISKKVTCADCTLRCDVYEALTNSNQGFETIHAAHATFRRHESICKQGGNVTHAMFLIKGTAKLYLEGLNNRNIILVLIKPPAYIGLLSFFENVEYIYSVSALEDCEVCMIDLPIIKKLYMEQVDLLIKLNKAFGRSSAGIMKKIISLNQKQIRGRMAESILYLSRFYDSENFRLPLTRKELGELSGISEENAVRILTEFRTENIIRSTGREIEILDVKLLKKICDLG